MNREDLPFFSEKLRKAQGNACPNRRYLIWRGFVISVVRSSLQAVVLIVVCHQLHSVLCLQIKKKLKPSKCAVA